MIKKLILGWLLISFGIFVASPMWGQQVYPYRGYQSRSIFDPQPGGGAYTGPGDIYTSSAWWGLRAYNAAAIGTNAIRLVRASDSTQQNFVTVAGGGLDLTSIGTFMAATTAKVVTLFDQTGGGNDVTQGTDANRPNFVLNFLGSLPAIEFVRASSTQLVSAALGTFAQPNTYSVVAYRKSASSGVFCIPFGSGTSGDQILFTNGGNLAIRFGGTTATSTVISNNAFHAIQATSNGVTSSTYLDGTLNSPLITGIGAQTGTGIVGNDAFGNFHDGYIMEVGFAAGDKTASNATINGNQHTFYGF